MEAIWYFIKYHVANPDAAHTAPDPNAVDYTASNTTTTLALVATAAVASLLG